MSPRGQNLLDFLELWQVFSTYVGDLRDPLWWPQERPVPIRVSRRPLGIPLPSMPGPKTLCGAEAGTSEFLSNAEMDLGLLLESPQGSKSSPRMGACTCDFLQSGSSSVTLPIAWIKVSVAFPQGFPTRFATRLSHRAVPRATVVGVDPRHENRGSAGKTGSSGMD